MRLLKSFVATCVAALMFGQMASAETPKEVAELFGRADAIGSPQISPNGKNLAVQCAPEVKRTVCIFDLETGSSITVPTMQDVRLVRHYWASDETLIMDVNLFETLRTSKGLRDYTFSRAVAFNTKNKKPVMLMKRQGGWLDANDLAAVKPSEPKSIIISMYQQLGAGMYLALMDVNLKNGKSKRIKTMSADTVDVVLTPEGEVAAELTYKFANKDNSELRIEANGKTLFERIGLKYNPLSLWGLDHTGNNLIVFLDEGAPQGLFRLSLVDGTLTEIEVKAPEGESVVYPVRDRRTLQIVGFETSADTNVQFLDDASLKLQLEAVKPAMKGESVTLASWSADRSQSVFKVADGGKPADYCLFDSKKGALSPIGNVAPHLDGRTLGTTERVSYKARDGLMIEAYLTLPAGKTRSDGASPLILLPHGGPEARDSIGFDWWAKAYASAGYAVLQPNFRGSSGYGESFLEAGYGEFGGKMVLDVLDGAEWAVAQGIAENGSVCAVGASYGGYSALMTGVLAGNEIKCVVAVNAVTNPFALLAEYRDGGFGANYLERYLGTDRYASKAARDAISPVLRAKDVRAPVLLIASEEDATVPFDQSKQFEAASNRADVSLVKLSGEDHYLRSTRARYEVLENSLTFLEQHLPAN